MRISSRVAILLLLFLLCLNYALRYPRTDHEIGLDPFVFQGMTGDLVQRGYARWILNPLSYFGLYPLSQPSGSMFLAAGLSELSGLTIEGAVWPFDLVIVTVALFGGFLLGLELRRDGKFALLVGAFFSLAPRLATDLTWEFPYRTVFTALVPILILLVLRWFKDRGAAWLVLGIFVLAIMAASHRLTVLMMGVFLAFILTAIGLVGTRALRVHFGSQLLEPSIRRLTEGVVVAGFLAVAGILIVGGGVLPNYATGELSTGSGTQSEILNLTVSLARGVGVLVILVPVGIIALFRSRAKGMKEYFFLTSFLAFLPTLSLRQYTGYYIAPFAAVFIANAVWILIEKLRRNWHKVVAAGLAIAIATATCLYVMDYDLKFGQYLTSEGYTDGLYVKRLGSGTVVVNNGFLGGEIFLVSGHPYLPVGGATTAFQSPELLIFGFIDSTTALTNIRPIPPGQLTIDSDSPFRLDGVQAEADWAFILLSAVDAIPNQYDHYNVTYVLESRSIEGSYTAYGNLYPSLLLQTAHGTRYVVYQTAEVSLLYLG